MTNGRKIFATCIIKDIFSYHRTLLRKEQITHSMKHEQDMQMDIYNKQSTEVNKHIKRYWVHSPRHQNSKKKYIIFAYQYGKILKT